MRHIHHALVLNFHQPPGNLQHLLQHAPWEAEEILFSLDRMPRSLWGWEDQARVHLALSGTLLETLSNPEFQAQVYGIIDCGSLLWHLQNEQLFSILGTGYYHPVLPLIPPADREEHLARWLGIARHLFSRTHFAGFWPPEMAFSMELIPLLRRFGYRYVLVDGEHVKPKKGKMRWEEIHYRPHIARYEGQEIIVIVRDRALSDAQEAGMELGWFMHEVEERTRWCDFPPLVTTASDGDNGGWFRNVRMDSNFWGVFYLPLLEQSRAGGALRPTFVQDYIDRYGVHGEVVVETGAWNTGWHSGHGFTQWTGSQTQRNTLARLSGISEAIHRARWEIGENYAHSPELHALLEEAMWRLLRSETSCNFYWGEDWVSRADADLGEALHYLHQVRKKM